jgi:hypothetical protein
LLVAQLGVTGRARALAALIDVADRELRKRYDDLVDFNADFEALQSLEEQPDAFTQAELDELRPLFGLYGIDLEKQIPSANLNAEFVSARQLAWHGVERQTFPKTIRHAVAARAYLRYGLILEALANRQRGTNTSSRKAGFQ